MRSFAGGCRGVSVAGGGGGLGCSRIFDLSCQLRQTLGGWWAVLVLGHEDRSSSPPRNGNHAPESPLDFQKFSRFFLKSSEILRKFLKFCENS